MALNPVDSTTKSENPPAFPQINQWDTDRMRMGDSGMTLRDYFAAKAMQGYIAMYAHPHSMAAPSALETAGKAYEYADAMLAERSQP